jgi:hypothetical protein
MTRARDLSKLLGTNSNGVIDNTNITLDAAEVPSLDTAKITTGTFASARIDNNSLSAITALPSGVGGTAWQTIITGATLTAVAGRGYWINTTSNACTVTLPASATNGDTIILVDYLRTWGTNAVTINTNSLKFQGNTSPNPVYNTSGQSVTLIYSGATQGWIPIVDDDVTLETPQNYSVDFLVVAGGGGSGAPGASTTASGGSGAGGFRTSAGASGGGASAESSLTFDKGITYTITVGAGGAGAPAAGNSSFGLGNNGNNSSISGTGITTITSSGGGAGANGVGPGYSGGSGGGACSYMSGGWNSPGAGTANQGYAGANGDNSQNASSKGGGGGGAGAAASTVNGGIGVASTITGSSVYYAGGGASVTGTGGNGGGANGVYETSGLPGTANTGGGGGGGFSNSTQAGGSGGSGVVILRMPTNNYTGTTTGSPTVTTSGSNTILKYTSSGTYTA